MTYAMCVACGSVHENTVRCGRLMTPDKLAEMENSVVLDKNLEIDRLNDELAHKQRVINQRDKDWHALMLLLIDTLGSEEERESPDDAIEEFDPWATLRAHAGLIAERDALRGEVEKMRRENAELSDRSESWRLAHVAWQTWAAFLLRDNTMGDRVARARLESIVGAAKAWRLARRGMHTNGPKQTLLERDTTVALNAAIDAALGAEGKP